MDDKKQISTNKEETIRNSSVEDTKRTSSFKLLETKKRDSKPKIFCSYCEKEITGPSIQETGKYYHQDHFRCIDCEKPLNRDNYKTFANNPYCDECYLYLTSPICYSCKKPIEGPVMQAAGKNWHPEHYTKQNFRCSKCGLLIEGNRFSVADGKPVCMTCANPRRSTTGTENKLLYKCDKNDDDCYF